ncbi:MAG: BatD family protein [Bdellovibrionaceae bacterium]|nr:BatD family protein [Bdellovibrionales bacterium]MCB9254889.1 BatD family protein [Pseudobdellovibrionaceae bacterium]
MVARLLIPITLFLSLSLRAEESFQFRTEFSKPEVYAGEEIRCDFVLYTNLNTVEVEVAKFPEFRGFWKDNLVLRQGKILVPYSRFASSPWNRIVLGSYRISAMVDEKSPMIRPMKLVLKNPFSEEADITIESETPKPLRIRALPPFPRKEGENFEGAVGQFTLSLDTPEIPYEQNEPATLRFSIRGQGNFQEIASAQVSLPPQVKVLSKRSFTQGSAPYQIQHHEWSLSVNHDEDLEIPPIHFNFFDPAQGRYEFLQSERGQFRFQAKLAPTQTIETVLELEPSREWAAVTELKRSAWFWILQGLTFIGLLGTLAVQRLQEKQRLFRQSPAYQLLQLRRDTEAAYSSQDYAKFLRLGSELLVLHLKHKTEWDQDGGTRESLLRYAARQTPTETIDQARRFFAAYEALLYSPGAPLTQQPTVLYEDLHRVLAA